VNEADEIISEVRATIYALGMGGSSRGVRDDIVALVSELRYTVGFELDISFDGAVDTAVTERVVEHLTATIREAVTNIERHANATKATIALSANDGHCQLGSPTMGGASTARVGRAVSGSPTCVASGRETAWSVRHRGCTIGWHRPDLAGADFGLTGPRPSAGARSAVEKLICASDEPDDGRSQW
jgi:hypothetical protein